MQDDREIVVGFLGQDRVSKILFSALKGRQAQQWALLVQSIPALQTKQEWEDIAELLNRCHLMYIGLDLAEHASEVIHLTRGGSTLLTSDLNGFAENGGMVGIYYDAEVAQVKLVINLKALRRSGISISSQLLKFSSIIE